MTLRRRKKIMFVAMCNSINSQDHRTVQGRAHRPPHPAGKKPTQARRGRHKLYDRRGSHRFSHRVSASVRFDSRRRDINLSVFFEPKFPPRAHDKNFPGGREKRQEQTLCRFITQPNAGLPVSLSLYFSLSLSLSLERLQSCSLCPC